ncbi:MAG: type II toxin-antitoxin system RelE/ParE family toxin [Patescibacteria group bacterium]
MYQFEFTEKAEKELTALDRPVQKRIFRKLLFWTKNKNPFTFAKLLKGTADTWRFRIGDYRVLVRPNERGIMIILVIVKVGHRKNVYE